MHFDMAVNGGLVVRISFSNMYTVGIAAQKTTS
jgi:hypothetical protein